MDRRRIVVGLSEHDTSHAASRWATAEAVRRGVPVHLVRVLTTPAPTAVTTPDQDRAVHHLPGRTGWDAADFARLVDHDAYAALQEEAAAVRREHPGLRVVTRVRHGAPRRLLVEESRSADLLVVGSSHDQTDGNEPEVLFTSRSDHLVTHAGCPVVVVGAAGGLSGDVGAGGGAGAADRGVVVGDDGSPAARAAARFAAQEALWLGEPLTVARSWWSPPGVPSSAQDPVREPGSERAVHEQALTTFLRVLRREFAGLDVGWRLVREREPWRALVGAGADARLLVVGSGGWSATVDRQFLVLGATSRSLLHSARGPVAVVPAGSAVRAPGRLPPTVPPRGAASA